MGVRSNLDGDVGMVRTRHQLEMLAKVKRIQNEIGIRTQKHNSTALACNLFIAFVHPCSRLRLNVCLFHGGPHPQRPLSNFLSTAITSVWP